MRIELHKKQSLIWQDKRRFKLLRCGRRFGKSYLEIVWLLHIAGTIPNANCWYVSPTYTQSESIAWVILKQIAGTITGTKFNETELSATLTNGSRIILKGANNPDSLRGTFVDALVVDEIDFMDWTGVWKVLRPLLVDRSAPAMFSSTPDGFRNLWELEERAKQDSTNWAVFHFSTYDNPHLPIDEIEAMKSEMNEAEWRQEGLAVYERPVGTVYPEWNSDHFKPVPYDYLLPVHVAFDWGVNDPTAIGWFQPQGGELRLIDYYEAPMDVQQIIQVLNSKDYKTPELYVGDEAGRATSQTTGTSVIQELGKRGIHVKPISNKNIPDLVRGAKKFIKNLYIDDTCTDFRNVILNYRYPTKKDTAFNQSNEIPLHDKWSHGARMFEYYCRYLSGHEPTKKRELIGYVGGDGITGYGRTPIYSGTKQARQFKGDFEI